VKVWYPIDSGIETKLLIQRSAPKGRSLTLLDPVGRYRFKSFHWVLATLLFKNGYMPIIVAAAQCGGVAALPLWKNQMKERSYLGSRKIDDIALPYPTDTTLELLVLP
jgi:hypothetical protein